MGKPRRSLRAGDLLEVSCGSHLAYLQYIGRHPEYGDAVFVYPKLFARRPADWNSLDDADGYMTYYPARRALRAGLVQLVQPDAPRPTMKIPGVYRRAGVTDRAGKASAWIIVRDGRETVCRKLTASQKRLPIASVWNHEFLIDRILENWRPEQET